MCVCVRDEGRGRGEHWGERESGDAGFVGLPGGLAYLSGW